MIGGDEEHVSSAREGPVNCTACGERNEPGALRCAACDEWLDAGAPEPARRGGASRGSDEESSGLVEAGGSETSSREAGDFDSSATVQHAGPALQASERSGAEPRARGTRPVALPAPPTPRCPSCGDVVAAGWRFCKACGSQLSPAAGSEARTSPAGALAPAPAASPARHVLLQLAADGVTVIKTHELGPGRTTLGRTNADIAMPSDATLSAVHAALQVDGERCVLRDLDSTNGSFVGLTRGEPLRSGSVILLGSQRLLLRSVPDGRGGRRHELVQVLPLGHQGKVFPLRGDHAVIGKERCDVAFPDDQFLSRQHAEIVRTTRGLVVRDLGSTNGTYAIVDGERALQDGDRVVLGEHLFEYRLVRD